MTKEEKPESELCYETRIFGVSIHCPDLDDDITMKPKCEKYGKELLWTVSGKLLKCKECLEESYSLS